MDKRIKTIIALSLIPQIFVVKLLANYPHLIEKYYSNGIYPYISKAFRIVFGWIPFSIGDIFYTIAAILILRFLILNWKMFFYQTRNFFREVFTVVSLLYFVFHLFWGLNYYRQPLSKSLDLGDDYTTEELLNFTKKLIAKANQVHLAITKNDTVVVEIPYSESEIYQMTSNGFLNLSKKIPKLSYEFRSLKSSIYSTALTYMGYGGYLNPFTHEAQVNSLAFSYKYPTVSCHEQAHQLGFSAENEANFVGYLAAVSNEDMFFKYSGYVYTLRYCLGELKHRDEQLFDELNNLINPGIIKNYLNVARFWNKYENRAEPAFKSSFNTFLKANNQKDGIKSYSYVVTLLVNYHKANPL